MARPPRTDKPQKITLNLSAANKSKLFRIASARSESMGKILDELIFRQPEPPKLQGAAR